MKYQARENIIKLKEYDASIIDNIDESIMLNANENPDAPYPGNENCKNANRYYDRNFDDLKTIFSKLYDAPKDNILISRGSDESIDLLIRVFCEPKADSIAVFSPTFSMYKVFADIQDAKTINIPLIQTNEGIFELNFKETEKLTETPPKLIFISNPEAPLGFTFEQKDLIKLCEMFKDKSIVVIDEAYIEFSRAESFVNKLPKYKNLAVLRTLSKAYAMAGLRLGCCIADSEIIKLMRKVQAPYPLSVKSTETAKKALCPEGLKYTQNKIVEIITEREMLIKKLQQQSCVKSIVPSETNFIFFEIDCPDKIKKLCDLNNIKLRFYSGELQNFIRLTVGSKKENLAVMKLFDSLCREL